MGCKPGGFEQKYELLESEDCSCNPEVAWGPGGRLGTRRSWRSPKEPEDSFIDPELVIGTLRNPEALKEPGGSSLDREIFDWNPEAIGEPGGSSSDFTDRTRNRVGNRGDHTPPSATTGTCLDFALCRSEAGQYRVPMLYSTSAGSHWQGPRCVLGCTGVLGSSDSILRLAHTHSCFMSHTHFDFVDVPLWPCHFLQGLARIGGLWRPDPARMPI
ncbi:hypothetical protein F2Q68_00016534 [Brassica cretica]|uniref:Uncharacterized protein n=1 Tax=Brassica cretica TaxID=69181 RepID=A0A8S9HDP9_BRACR|nr:hypothetical protein F2Q68_00016534 [Brassica cretica]